MFERRAEMSLAPLREQYAPPITEQVVSQRFLSIQNDSALLGGHKTASGVFLC
jgi:hypothetical protein